jgi:hypothetical protein
MVLGVLTTDRSKKDQSKKTMDRQQSGSDQKTRDGVVIPINCMD